MMRNMLPDKQLLNNSPMRILRISHHKLLVEMLKTGERLAIPRHWFEIDVAFLNVKVYSLQFAVRLAYAVTGNRSQSLTLVKAALDLRTWPFTEPQSQPFPQYTLKMAVFAFTGVSGSNASVKMVSVNGRQVRVGPARVAIHHGSKRETTWVNLTIWSEALLHQFESLQKRAMGVN